jgi:toxin ParE1/3/4
VGRRFLLVTRGARANLNQVIAHSEHAWGVEQAANYQRAIEDAFERLLDHPELRVAREDIAAGARVLTVKHHRIIYRFTIAQVMVLRVLHERMDLRV